MAERPSAVLAARARAGRALRHPGNWVQLAKFAGVGATGYVINLGVYTALLRGHVAFQGLRFLTVAVVAYAANLGILSALIALGLDKVAAQAIAIVLVTPLNFVGNKLWSFRR